MNSAAASSARRNATAVARPYAFAATFFPLPRTAVCFDGSVRRSLFQHTNGVTSRCINDLLFLQPQKTQDARCDP